MERLTQERKLRFILLCLFFNFSSCFADSISFESLTPLAVQTNVHKKYDFLVPEHNTLVQFWATWCHSCSGFMYDLDKLAREVGSPYLAINIDDNLEDSKNYLSKHPLYKQHPARYWYDKNKIISTTLNITTVPTVMVIDSNKNVLWVTRGHLNSDDFLSLRRWLKRDSQPNVGQKK
jgi:thiol-disulfide isomerase/thioredoxin